MITIYIYKLRKKNRCIGFHKFYKNCEICFWFWNIVDWDEIEWDYRNRIEE